MRLYPPSWCFSNFCWSKASSFIKSILFGSPPIRFRFEIPALPLKFTSCLDSKPMFSGCTSPLFAVQIFCWSQSPIVSIEIQCVFQFGQVQSHCSQKYSEVFFFFMRCHNPFFRVTQPFTLFLSSGFRCLLLFVIPSVFWCRVFTMVCRSISWTGRN